MKKLSRMLGFSLLLLMLLGIGCTHIPMAERPAEVQRAFATSYNQTWEGVLSVVARLQGTVITGDKATGVVAYCTADKRTGGRIYMNVYVKKDLNEGKTIVYLVPRLRDTAYAPENERGIEKDFFDTLRAAIGG